MECGLFRVVYVWIVDPCSIYTTGRLPLLVQVFVKNMHFILGCLYLGLFVAIALYPDRVVGTASRRDLPGPRGFPLIGNLVEAFPERRNMIELLKRWFNIYGPICTFTLPGWGRLVAINRPEWLAHVKKRTCFPF
jgi:hypothetical protein